MFSKTSRFCFQNIPFSMESVHSKLHRNWERKIKGKIFYSLLMLNSYRCVLPMRYTGGVVLQLSRLLITELLVLLVPQCRFCVIGAGCQHRHVGSLIINDEGWGGKGRFVNGEKHYCYREGMLKGVPDRDGGVVALLCFEFTVLQFG